MDDDKRCGSALPDLGCMRCLMLLRADIRLAHLDIEVSMGPVHRTRHLPEEHPLRLDAWRVAALNKAESMAQLQHLNGHLAIN